MTERTLKEKFLLEMAKPLYEQDRSIIEEFRRMQPIIPEPTSRTNGYQRIIDPEKERILEEENQSHQPFRKRARNEQENYAYVEEVRLQVEMEQIRTTTEVGTSASLTNTITNLTLTDNSTFTNKTEFLTEEEEAHESDLIVYNNPKFNLKGFDNYPNLPIRDLRARILHSLEKNNIFIIQGNTGCGKTTQVPQMILDHSANLNRHCNILVTQPRRLAALSVCKRVCDERNWEVGSICGYKFQGLILYLNKKIHFK
jgi:HrpA-like RNA helicase